MTYIWVSCVHSLVLESVCLIHDASRSLVWLGGGASLFVAGPQSSSSECCLCLLCVLSPDRWWDSWGDRTAGGTSDLSSGSADRQDSSSPWLLISRHTHKHGYLHIWTADNKYFHNLFFLISWPFPLKIYRRWHSNKGSMSHLFNYWLQEWKEKEPSKKNINRNNSL